MTYYKPSFAFLVFFLAYLNLAAQWVPQWNGFNQSRGISNISLSSESVLWATVYDPFDLNIPLNSFTKTTDGGNHWTNGTINGADGMQAGCIHGYDALTAWVAMVNKADTGGKIFMTTDVGQTWTPQDSAVFHVNPRFVHFWGTDLGVCIGDPYEGRFEIFTTVNGGADWVKVDAEDIPISLPGEYTLTSSFCVRNDSLWFGGATNGRIFFSSDFGKSWSFIPSPLPDMKKVIFYDSLNGLIGSPDLTNLNWVLYATANGGLTWEAVDAEGIIHFSDLAYVPGTPSSFVSAGYGLSYSNDGGKHWMEFDGTMVNPSPYYTALAFYSPVKGWAGGINYSPPTAGGVYSYNGPALEINALPHNDYSMMIFPNPAKEGVTLRISGLVGQKAGFMLADLLGREVLHEDLEINTAVMSTHLGLNHISSGHYIATLLLQNAVIQQQLIIE